MARRSSRVCGVLMTGPLAPFADAFAAGLRERGYTPLTAVNQLRQVRRLSGWMEAGGVSVAELSSVRVDEFLAWQRTVGCHSSQVSRPGLVCLLEVLDGLGMLTPGLPAVACSPIDRLLLSFEQYLVSERGLAPGTIVGYLAHARWFVEGPGGGPVLRVPDRSALALDDHHPSRSPSHRAQGLARSRYTFVTRLCPQAK